MENIEKINIVFSSDNNYAQYLGVTLCSIFENSKNKDKIDIYVLDGGILKENKDKLKIIESKYNFTIIYIEIDTSLFKDFYISGYLTQATYYRIMIPDLLPNVKKVLYLDCDIIVKGDISELYNTNIDNYFFAAVEDEGFISKFFSKLEIAKNEKYFNAGVMLMNLDKWRETNINKTIINFINEKREQLESHDQDAINSILYGKWLNLPYKYNVTTTIPDNHQINNDVLIVHYTGPKPWNYLCLHPLKNEYFNYLKKTPWNESKKYKDKSIKNIIIKFLEKIIYFIFPKNIINLIKKIKRKIGIKFY